MKRLPFSIVALSLVLVAAPVCRSTGPAAAQRVREPAVAGLFYPRDAAALARTIDACLAGATSARTGGLKALICPHAGYAYSGPVAGSAFRLLRGAKYTTVVVLAPAHCAALEAASVSAADVFRTPLGDVPISDQARRLAALPPFALEPRCFVQRPEWAPQSSRPLPERGAERADTWEHADEVEVPFLQQTLSGFELVPVVMGDVDTAAAARALSTVLDDSTLLVVSSDLSHYHPYAEARRLDRQCVDAICTLDVRRAAAQEACGRTPILTLLHIARERGWRPQLLDLRNSGDTSGDKSRVVGYAAIAFYAPPAGSAISAPQRQLLLELARQSVRAATGMRTTTAIAVDRLDPALQEDRGVFVTLTKRGALRGCIGHIVAQMPLYRAVIENARAAAIHDPRFLPVAPREVDQLEIEISVLAPPQPLAFDSPDDLLRQLRPHQDGVVLRITAGSATYLPQVWEQLPDKPEFLDSLSVKAGGRPGDWRRPGTSVAVYRVESFKESDRGE